jgi:nicotinate-nucleotide adenylyltransferase
MGGMKTNQRIGYFGGTFDPPHLGHVILAVEACHQLDLDALEWILTPDPPHKTDRQITPLEDRLAMLRLVIADHPEFSLNESDIKRDPPHFAADTVEIIRRERPSAVLVYVIGEDSLRDIPDWHEPGRFISGVDCLAVAPRPGIITDLEQLDQWVPGLADKVVFLTGVRFEIASTVIRTRIKHKAPFKHFLPEAVAEYLVRNQLYT